MQVDRALANALDAQLAAATARDEVKEELEEDEVAAEEEEPLGPAEVEVGDRDEADAAFGGGDDAAAPEGGDGEAERDAEEEAEGEGDAPQLAGPTHTHTSIG